MHIAFSNYSEITLRYFRIISFLLIGQHFFAQVQVFHNGSVQQYSTISAAFNNVDSYDTIYIPDGNYFESISFDGTGKHHITVTGESIENTIISAADPLYLLPNSLWTHVSGNTYKTQTSYQPNNDFIRIAFLNDSLIFTYDNFQGFNSLYAGNGCYFDQATSELYINLNNVNPNSIGLQISRYQNVLYLKHCNSLKIENLTCKSSQRAGVFLRYDDSENIWINNVKVINCLYGFLNWGDGVNIEIKNSRFVSYFNEKWSWDEIKHPPYNGLKTMESAGLSLDRGIGVSIDSCDISGYFDGIDYFSTSVSVDIVSTAISNNKIHNIFDDAICLEGRMQGVKIYNNSIYNSFVGISLAPFQSDSSFQTHIYRNRIYCNKEVLWTDTNGIIRSFGSVLKMGGSTNKPLQYVNFYHNTLVGHIGIVKLLGGWNEWSNLKFYNNIFHGISSSPIYDTGLSLDGNYFDGNCYFRSGSVGSLIKKWNSFTSNFYLTLDDAISSVDGQTAQWEVHGQMAYPEYVYSLPVINSDTKPNFILDISSSLINTGVNLPPSFLDYTPLYGIPDIGAEEHVLQFSEIFENGNDVKISGNGSNKIVIDLDLDSFLQEFFIYSIDGKLIHHFSEISNRLIIESNRFGYNPGIYILVAVSVNSTTCYKLLLN